ncbi:MAG: 8-amino-7-oxononanoate synthase [uncultured Nocardioidaceae bacterium]|uniref:8-amino-7-oxononanoate synthase n=1 Tax=uncultured Nocardioidaceae bacterium TaxID=253824 RepID=A0A6J4MJ94_9ACTN|nr:MAG: 8-amino-7-oxononanoate synthase [uncultured Nocardioidaceae bacterium]
MTGPSPSGWAEWLEDRALDREARGLVRRLTEHDATTPLLDLAGNDYLGLACDPRVVEGAVEAARRYGAGARASRLVTGTLSLHTALEQRLAAFTGFGSGLVLSTGYAANLAAVTALADRDTLVVSDAHVHASLVDACRLSRARVTVVPHNDVAAVEAALAGWDDRALVLAETVYSVLGDRAPVEALAAVCEAHGALLVADEAHGLGVAGPGGRGVLHEAGLAGAAHVVATATLSKALGAQGGVVLGPAAVREHLVNTARAFVYDTGLAPAATGAALAALGVVEREPSLVTRLHRVAGALAASCGVPAPPGAVMSVAVAGPQQAVAAVEAAAGAGIRIGCFRPPSTPDGSSRLRLTARATCTDVDLALADEVLRSVLAGTER